MVLALGAVGEFELGSSDAISGSGVRARCRHRGAGKIPMVIRATYANFVRTRQERSAQTFHAESVTSIAHIRTQQVGPELIGTHL